MSVCLWNRAARRLTSAVRRRAIILLYHRVAELETDPWSLAVTPRHFAEQMEVLRRGYRPIGLRQLAAALGTGAIPRRTVVVTFDDGYADNLHNAQPLLARHAIPATAFLTTSALGSEREYWWDELDRLLLQPGRLPGELRLSVGGRDHRWALGQAAEYGEAEARRQRGWLAGQPAPGPRQALYRALWELLHPLASAEREQALGQLRAWAGRAPVGRPSHRTLTVDEARALGLSGLVEIGAHTVTHPSLAALGPDEQRAAIGESKACLETLLDRPVTSFAYPYGRRHDYDEATLAIVRAAGFDCACANWSGAAGRSSDIYQLPRSYVHDWDGATFERRLAEWFSRP